MNGRWPAAQAAVVLPGERGVALLLVLMLLTLVTAVVSDFQYSSQVDVELAYHARDALQAESNALSALRFRALLLKQARTMQSAMAGIAGLSGGSKPPPIAAIMELIPVECGLLSQLMRGSDMGEGASEDFFPGECLASSESEHAKVPVNLLGSPQSAAGVSLMLLGMLRDPRLRPFFEHDDATGQHADSPAQLIAALADWIDPDHVGQGNLGDEDRYYQSADPPYRSKNAPLDTVSEMQLVHGISDGIYNALKDGVSAYSASGQIELASAPLPMVLSSLAGAIASPEGVEAYFGAAPALGARLGLLRAIGGPMLPLTLELLKGALGDVGLLGLVDGTRLAQIFTDGSSATWYTLRAQGQVGRASRRLRMVFQADEGIFYYARME